MKPRCKLCNAEMESSEDCGGDCYNCISEIEADMTGGDERGVCMNCGDEMDFSPTHPWCPKCDEKDEEGEAELRFGGGSEPYEPAEYLALARYYNFD